MVGWEAFKTLKALKILVAFIEGPSRSQTWSHRVHGILRGIRHCVSLGIIRGEGYNQIFKLSFWHLGGTSAHKNKTLRENQKFLASNLPPTKTQNVWDKWLKIAQNTKGGPLDEKYFFEKNLRFGPQQAHFFRFSSLIPQKTYISLDFEPSTPLFASVHGARSVHGEKMGRA